MHPDDHLVHVPSLPNGCFQKLQHWKGTQGVGPKFPLNPQIFPEPPPQRRQTWGIQDPNCSWSPKSLQRPQGPPTWTHSMLTLGQGDLGIQA